MNDMDRLLKLQACFLNLKDILVNENEDNWIKAIKNILHDIQLALDNKQDTQATIRDIRYKYYLINSGNGSFTDFFICRDDFNERVEANKVLEEVKSNIVKSNNDFKE